jgi:DNA polymerase III subunit delta'
MTFPTYFDSKNSLNLYYLFENLEFLINLYNKKKFPKVLMLSGKKGSGKATLISHLMYYIFDRVNYNKKTNQMNYKSIFYNQFLNNIYANIIYLSGADFKSIKVDDIRILKTKIYQTSISNKPRFIILDDVELFNNNSLNALLKIIEEPSKNNCFLLINNKSKTLIRTIESRCLDIKIILNEKKRMGIIEALTSKFNISPVIDPESSQLSPGNFVKFNYIFDENNISVDDDFLKNLQILLNLFKKNKDVIFIDMVLFLTETYFRKIKSEKSFNNGKIIEYKSFVFENINKFFLYNLNQNALLNTISNKLNDE